jgi:predicted secreted acid phosphatase
MVWQSLKNFGKKLMKGAKNIYNKVADKAAPILTKVRETVGDDIYNDLKASAKEALQEKMGEIKTLASDHFTDKFGIKPEAAYGKFKSTDIYKKHFAEDEDSLKPRTNSKMKENDGDWEDIEPIEEIQPRKQRKLF